MAKQPIIVRGATFDNVKIARLTKRLDNVGDAITTIVNAGALQVAQHGNINWINDLLNHDLMRIKSGKLSALGKNVAEYAIAHFPRLAWDTENEKMVAKKYNADHIHATHFVAVGLDVVPTVENDDGEQVPALDYCAAKVGKKVYKLHGDFQLTFSQFLEFKANQTKAEKNEGDEVKSVKADSVSKQIDKYLEAFDEKRFVGSVDDLAAVRTKLHALYTKLDAAHTAAVKAAPTIDEAKVHESNNVKASSKSRQAK
jgi:hypothetical protein